jgi:hypothetical protein
MTLRAISVYKVRFRFQTAMANAQPPANIIEYLSRIAIITPRSTHHFQHQFLRSLCPHQLEGSAFLKKVQYFVQQIASSMV